MPGVPPDAVAQVKKGLRGLFSRRKSKQSQQQQTQSEPTASSSHTPTATNTAAAAAPAIAASTPQTSKTVPSTNPPPPQPGQQGLNKAPQLSEPSQSEIGKDIDLNPSAATDVKDQAYPTTAADSTKPNSSPGTTAPSQTQPRAPNPLATDPKATPVIQPSSTGMSATSGPLGDHLVEGFIDDDVGPKGGTKPETKPETQVDVKGGIGAVEEGQNVENVEKNKGLGEEAKA